ncbi:MAG: tRNA (adenosine(37)-N6)-dimethylallyltransferase MiaA [Rhodoluna sp.]
MSTAIAPELICIVGPTGSGKSNMAINIALDLASKGIKAEIVNADSMQLYKGMDIGTAKVPVSERAGIVHHLLDWLEIEEENTAARYQIEARKVIAQLINNGVLPIVVGGSMLYIAALINTFEFPGRDEALRAQLEQDLIDLGPIAMHKRLELLDEVAASRIEPQNGRRTVRALEIVMITGEPFAASLPEQFESFLPVLEIGLNSAREHLVERLATRVRGMWSAGLIEEVRGLIDKGIRDSKTASQAIGYAQALASIDGRLSEEEAIDETILLTQRYARRQMSWFRRDPRINWFDYQSPTLQSEVMKLVYSSLQHKAK